MSRTRFVALFALIFSAGALFSCGKKHKPVSGFCSLGSEEFNYLLDNWSVAFRRKHPETPRFFFDGRGNKTGALALRKGACNMAVTTRPLFNPEVHSFVKKYGAPPLAIPVALEALGAVVHEKNPLREITLENLRRVLTTGVAPGPGGASLKLKNAVFNSASDRYRWLRRAFLKDENFAPGAFEAQSAADLNRYLLKRTDALACLRPRELEKGLRFLTLKDSRGNALPHGGLRFFRGLSAGSFLLRVPAAPPPGRPYAPARSLHAFAGGAEDSRSPGTLSPARKRTLEEPGPPG